MFPHILLSVASCPTARRCAGDHDGVSLAIVLGLGALILAAVLLLKLGGPDKR
ncbi:MAG TPA: hypothetical protein VJN88_13855 [Ktedonobacterales bacterium]|nr:hypothetical protein [Ktedonobacterales bacterium]